MLITRRALLASLGALGLGLATVSWSSGVRSWVLTQIEKEFGAEIAGTDDAAAFTNELPKHVGLRWVQAHFWLVNDADRTATEQYRNTDRDIRLHAIAFIDDGSVVRHLFDRETIFR